MTFSALDWMRGVRDARWPSPAKAVAHALALRADEFGNAWPSIDQLALDAGLGRTAAKNALAELRRVNVVTITSGSVGRVVNRYQLQPVASWRVEDPEPVASRPVSTGRLPTGRETTGRQTAPTGRETTLNRSPDDQDLPKNCPELPKGEARAPAKAKADRRKPETELPPNFDSEIRPAAVAWAGEKLRRPAAWASERLDLMASKCIAKGYRNRDWLQAARNWLQKDHVEALEREQRFGKPPGALQHEKQRRDDGYIPFEQRPESRRFDQPAPRRGGPPTLAFGGTKT